MILLGVPEFSLLNLESADYYAQLAEEFNIPIENTILSEVESDNSMKSDQIHPNRTGYQKMAEAVNQLLIKAGAL